MSDYSSTYPTQSPVFAFDAKAGKLDSRLSYSRSSGGTYMSSEKSLNSENLLLQSQDFDTTWTVNHMSAPTGSQTAPDGSSTAWLLSAASGTGAATIAQNASPRVSSNTSYTLVCHVKAGTASHAYISFRGAPTESAYATIDFASPLSPTSGGSVMTGISSSSVALGNSWYRLSLTFTTSTISGGYSFIYVGTSDGTSPTSGGYVSYDSTGDTMYAWGAQLSSTNSKVYDSPTTTQISRKYSPLLKTAAANAPRFEYSATDGQSVGLLIESSASNLQRYGSKFESWVGGTFAGVYADSAIAPNGQLEARLAVPPDAVGSKFLLDNTVSSTSGDTYTASVYAKSAGHRYVQLAFGSGAYGATKWATFDLETGSVDANGLTASAAESVGNGWYRLSITATATSSSASSAFVAFVGTATAARNAAHVGDDYSGVLLWGYQYEEGSSASSLVDTGSQNSALTRASDSCSVALSDVGITSGQDLTAVVEGDAAEIAGAALIGFDDGSSSNYARILRHHSNNNYTFDVRTNASSQAVITLNSSSTANEFAFRLEQNNIGASAGGSAVTTDTSATLGLMTTMQIGNAYWGTQANGTISRVSIYSEPLSDTNLTALTSS